MIDEETTVAQGLHTTDDSAGYVSCSKLSITRRERSVQQDFNYANHGLSIILSGIRCLHPKFQLISAPSNRYKIKGSLNRELER